MRHFIQGVSYQRFKITDIQENLLEGGEARAFVLSDPTQTPPLSALYLPMIGQL